MPIDVKAAFRKATENKIISVKEEKDLRTLVAANPEARAELKKQFDEFVSNPQNTLGGLGLDKFKSWISGGAGPVTPPVTPPSPVIPTPEPVRAGRKENSWQKIPAGLQGTIIDFDADPAANPAALKHILNRESTNLQKPSDIFRSFHKLDMGAKLPNELGALKEALKDPITIPVESRTFESSPGKSAARVTYYDDAAGKDPNITKLVHDPELSDYGIFFKDMYHYDSGFAEGEAEAFFKGDAAVFGHTHRGQLIPTQDKDGKPAVGWMDYPTNYGRLRASPEGNRYGAKVEYWSPKNMEFLNGRPSDPQIKSYVENLRTMGVLQMMVFPFAGDDANALYTNYKFNKLDLRTDADIPKWIDVQSNPAAESTRSEAKKLAVYCAEGAWNNTNTPPINQASVDAGLISQQAHDNLKKMEKAFNETPGTNEQKWQGLVAKGFVTQQQIDSLADTGMLDIPFKLAADDVKPLSHYKPVGFPESGAGKGLNAKPITISGLIGGLIEINFPREKIAARLAEKLKDASPEALAQAAAMVKLPPTADKETIRKTFGAVMASQFTKGVVAGDGMELMIKEQIRYAKMDDESKAKVDALLTKYIEVLSDPSLPQEKLMAKVRELDAETEKTEITYPGFDKGPMWITMPPQIGTYSDHGVGGAAMPGLKPLTYLMDRNLVYGGVG